MSFQSKKAKPISEKVCVYIYKYIAIKKLLTFFFGCSAEPGDASCIEIPCFFILPLLLFLSLTADSATSSEL